MTTASSSPFAKGRCALYKHPGDPRNERRMASYRLYRKVTNRSTVCLGRIMWSKSPGYVDLQENARARNWSKAAQSSLNSRYNTPLNSATPLRTPTRTPRNTTQTPRQPGWYCGGPHASVDGSLAILALISSPLLVSPRFSSFLDVPAHRALAARGKRSVSPSGHHRKTGTALWQRRELALLNWSVS